MLVEVLASEGCPNAGAASALVRELVSELGVDAEVHDLRVESPEEAERLRFLGSPTIRVDGNDVEPGADERQDFALACRVYRTAAGPAGVPERDLVRAALAARAG